MDTIDSKYTHGAIILHWLIAVLITVNVVLALSADSLSDQNARFVIDTHKSIGITVLGLGLMRLLWRLSHRPPELSKSYPRRERRAAFLVHMLLYVLIFALPLSGWMHDSAWKDAATHPMELFGLFQWPRIGWIMEMDASQKETWHQQLGALHTYLGYVLYGLVALHIAGALKHQFWDGHPEFRRMWF